MALAIVVSHSIFVGNRQSPGDEPSRNPQSPALRPAAASLAAFQFACGRQLACFSQTRPVSVSVTVPFPQSAYRPLLSEQGPAAEPRPPLAPSGPYCRCAGLSARAPAVEPMPEPTSQSATAVMNASSRSTG